MFLWGRIRQELTFTDTYSAVLMLYIANIDPLLERETWLPDVYGVSGSSRFSSRVFLSSRSKMRLSMQVPSSLFCFCFWSRWPLLSTLFSCALVWYFCVIPVYDVVFSCDIVSHSWLCDLFISVSDSFLFAHASEWGFAGVITYRVLVLEEKVSIYVLTIHWQYWLQLIPCMNGSE